MKNNELTERQEEILNFILQSINKYGFPPTIPEIQKEFDFKSPTTVNDHLNALARKGYIIRHSNKSRGIELVNPESQKKIDEDIVNIPIVGRVAAGSPILAEQNIEGNISIDKTFVSSASNVFALRVKGQSMKDAGIFDGDYVIVKQQSILNNGEIGVVMLDDEATVKRFYEKKDQIILKPENKEMKAIIVNKNEKNISVIGKVKAVLRKI